MLKAVTALLILVALCTQTALAQESGECSSIHNEPVAIFIGPTDEEIEAMKKEYGEDDFYIIADDAMYYNWQATTFLKQQNVPFCSTEKESHRFITKSGKEYLMDKGCDSWCLILWNGSEKPVYASAIDMISYESYLKEVE